MPQLILDRLGPPSPGYQFLVVAGDAQIADGVLPGPAGPGLADRLDDRHRLAGELEVDLTRRNRGGHRNRKELPIRPAMASKSSNQGLPQVRITEASEIKGLVRATPAKRDPNRRSQEETCLPAMLQTMLPIGASVSSRRIFCLPANSSTYRFRCFGLI